MTEIIIASVTAYLIFDMLKKSDKREVVSPTRPNIRKGNINFNPDYNRIIDGFCKKYNFPYNDVIRAMIMVESDGNAFAVGKANEYGLLQLMPIAIQDVNNNYGTNFQHKQMFSPTVNIACGILFLKLQYKRTGNIQDAIRAYNAGERGAMELNRGHDYLERVRRFVDV